MKHEDSTLLLFPKIPIVSNIVGRRCNDRKLPIFEKINRLNIFVNALLFLLRIFVEVRQSINYLMQKVEDFFVIEKKHKEDNYLHFFTLVDSIHYVFHFNHIEAVLL